MVDEWIIMPPVFKRNEPKEYPWPFTPFAKKLDQMVNEADLEVVFREYMAADGSYTVTRLYASPTNKIILQYGRDVSEISTGFENPIPNGDFVRHTYDVNDPGSNVFIPDRTILERLSTEEFGNERVIIKEIDEELKSLLFNKYDISNIYREEPEEFFNNLQTPSLMFNRDLPKGSHDVPYTVLGNYEDFGIDKSEQFEISPSKTLELTQKILQNNYIH